MEDLEKDPFSDRAFILKMKMAGEIAAQLMTHEFMEVDQAHHFITKRFVRNGAGFREAAQAAWDITNAVFEEGLKRKRETP